MQEQTLGASLESVETEPKSSLPSFAGRELCWQRTRQTLLTKMLSAFQKEYENETWHCFLDAILAVM